MATYKIGVYEKDVEKYSTRCSVKDIHDEIWDIISDAIWAAYPRDNMSEPHNVTIRKAYDSAEFDEKGFTAYFGVDNGCMITAVRV